MKTFGGTDVLVNNAGTAFPKTFEETTMEELQPGDRRLIFAAHSSPHKLR